MNRRLLGPVGGPIIFLLVAGLVFAGLGWVTVAALRVEEAQREAAVRADQEKDLRVALWRLDGRMLPALGVEDSRRFHHYGTGDATPAYGPACAPLLADTLPKWMRLHFQLDPETGWESPQVLTLETAEQLRELWPDLPLHNATPERAILLDTLRAKYPARHAAEVFALRERAFPADTPLIAPAIVDGVAPPRSEPPVVVPEPGGSVPPMPAPVDVTNVLPPVTAPPAEPATEALGNTEQAAGLAARDAPESVNKKFARAAKDVAPQPPPAPNPRPAQELEQLSTARQMALSGEANPRSQTIERGRADAKPGMSFYAQGPYGFAQGGSLAQNNTLPNGYKGVPPLSFGTPPAAPPAATSGGFAGGYAPTPGSTPALGPAATTPVVPVAPSGPGPIAGGLLAPQNPTGQPFAGLSGSASEADRLKKEAEARALDRDKAGKAVAPAGEAAKAEDRYTKPDPRAFRAGGQPGELDTKPGGFDEKKKADEAETRGLTKLLEEGLRLSDAERTRRMPGKPAMDNAPTDGRKEKGAGADQMASPPAAPPGGGFGGGRPPGPFGAPAPPTRGDAGGVGGAGGPELSFNVPRPSPAPGPAATPAPAAPPLPKPAAGTGPLGDSGSPATLGRGAAPAAPVAPAATAPPVTLGVTGPGRPAEPIAPTPDPAPPAVLEPVPPPAVPEAAAPPAGPPFVAVHLGSMRPQWLTAPDGTEVLVLVRAARLENKTVYQGVVLDWPRLQEVLKDEVKDLFPGAKLVPVKDPAGVSPERAMTALPVQLDPGPAPTPPPVGWTPLRFGLVLAWAAALIAFVAVGLCGWSLIDLSERRIRFVSAVTHELRTPLTSLRLYLDLLLSGMVQDEEKRKEYLSTLNAESDRLHRLIDNVLDFARLERRRKGGAVQPVKVAELLDRVRQTWTDRCGPDGKELVVISTLPPETEVCTDPDLVQQIVGNLIDNARKYTRDAADSRIWVWAKPDGRKRVAIEVEDRGPGVPPRERSLIFRPFRRGESADTRAGGAGLGLALSKQWAEVLGGRLTYRPADGGTGSCFRLELPAK